MMVVVMMMVVLRVVMFWMVFGHDPVDQKRRMLSLPPSAPRLTWGKSVLTVRTLAPLSRTRFSCSSDSCSAISSAT
jgi:hypothetical protein